MEMSKTSSCSGISDYCSGISKKLIVEAKNQSVEILNQEEESNLRMLLQDVCCLVNWPLITFIIFIFCHKEVKAILKEFSILISEMKSFRYQQAELSRMQGSGIRNIDDEESKEEVLKDIIEEVNENESVQKDSELDDKKEVEADVTPESRKEALDKQSHLRRERIAFELNESNKHLSKLAKLKAESVIFEQRSLEKFKNIYNLDLTRDLMLSTFDGRIGIDGAAIKDGVLYVVESAKVNRFSFSFFQRIRRHFSLIMQNYPMLKQALSVKKINTINFYLILPANMKDQYMVIADPSRYLENVNVLFYSIESDEFV